VDQAKAATVAASQLLLDQEMAAIAFGQATLLPQGNYADLGSAQNALAQANLTGLVYIGP
jgi:hypothetical protein